MSDASFAHSLATSAIEESIKGFLELCCPPVLRMAQKGKKYFAHPTIFHPFLSSPKRLLQVGSQGDLGAFI